MFRILNENNEVIWEGQASINNALGILESLVVHKDCPQYTLIQVLEVKKYCDCYGCKSFVDGECVGEC